MSPRRLAPAFAVAALALGSLALPAAPAAAATGTITLAVTSDPIEDAGFTLTATGTTDDARLNVYGTIKPAGQACGATSGADTGPTTFVATDTTAPTYAVSTQVVVDDPGAYVLCGWLEDSATNVAVAATSTPVTVRSAAATLKLEGKRTVRAGRPATIRLTGTSELQRDLFAKAKPKRKGTTCASSYFRDQSIAFVIGEDVQGTFEERGKIDTITLRRPGRYLVCGWVQEDTKDRTPEATASYVITVVRKR